MALGWPFASGCAGRALASSCWTGMRVLQLLRCELYANLRNMTARSHFCRWVLSSAALLLITLMT